VSGHGGAPKGLGTRAVQALALAVTFGLLFLATRLTPELEDQLGTVAAIGFLLLAGTLCSELLETIGLPHLSGYLLAGIIGGPHILHLIDHHTVERLSPVNTLALSLIALSGGAELRMSTLREVAKSLACATVFQSFLTWGVMAAVFLACSRFIPFVAELGFSQLFGVAILWGVLSIARSPSACMGILAQTRAKGPVATFSLAFIMASDVVVVVLLAIALMIARPLVTGSGGFSMNDVSLLWHELVGSIAFGTTLGLALAAYLKLVGRGLLLLLLAIGFGLSDFLRYVHVDPTLAFLVAGFVVQNLTAQGPKLLHAVEQTGSVVYVVFFATAGAHLNVPLLKQMWPIAITLFLARASTTYISARLASRLANDVPSVRAWGWSSLVSQAGFALGLAGVVSRAFPSIGEGFQALAIASVAINEMVGPVLFKFALDRAGETAQEDSAISRTSLVPPAPTG
jgi:Kef-type K+ transport system membrane component KefB